MKAYETKIGINATAGIEGVRIPTLDMAPVTIASFTISLLNCESLQPLQQICMSHKKTREKNISTLSSVLPRHQRERTQSAAILFAGLSVLSAPFDTVTRLFLFFLTNLLAPTPSADPTAASTISADPGTFTSDGTSSCGRIVYERSCA